MKEGTPMIKKIFILLGIILIAGTSLSIASMGKGEIVKICSYTDQNGPRIQGAYVEIWDDTDTVLNSGYTNPSGQITFSDLPLNEDYFLYVDLEDDGTWETLGEQVTLNLGFKAVWNHYSPPTITCDTTDDKKVITLGLVTCNQ